MHICMAAKAKISINWDEIWRNEKGIERDQGEREERIEIGKGSGSHGWQRRPTVGVAAGDGTMVTGNECECGRR